MPQTLVIVGNGMASTKLVEHLTNLDPTKFDIHIFGAEPRPAYNRVLLSPLLAGDLTHEELELKPTRWWSDRHITHHLGCTVTTLDRSTKTLQCANGSVHSYDILILATGSDAIRLAKPGMDLKGVLTFRDVEDAEAMLTAAKDQATFVVIGGGLLGLEAAYGLKRAGAHVTLVHLMDRLMERQLDPAAGELLKTAMERLGIQVLLNADTAEVMGTDHVTGLRLTDGRILAADHVVCAVGVRPQISLAKAAGLVCQRGICVDDHLQTSDPHIFAIGECAEHRGIAYGLVEPAYAQARMLAEHLTGHANAAYQGTVVATNLKVSGVGVFSAGDVVGRPDDSILTLHDAVAGTYKKLLIRGDKLIGTILLGDHADALWYFDLIQNGTSVSGLRDHMIFGPDIGLQEAA